MRQEEMERRLSDYRKSLIREEKKEATVKKYLADIRHFLEFAKGQKAGVTGEVDKFLLIAYKEGLRSCYKPSSVNSRLSGLNRYLRWLGEEELIVKLDRIQKRCSLGCVLTVPEYRKLLDYAMTKGKTKYYCIMKTLASTGIRVGELQYITCEVLERQAAVISHKGKIREIYLPDGLCELLAEYCTGRGIQKGIIFSGWFSDRPLDVSGVWKTMKRMAAEAEVDPNKVYPHSFRHLFARTYMKKVGNLAVLSDILGHTSIETTRIYTMGTIEEIRESMAHVGL